MLKRIAFLLLIVSAVILVPAALPQMEPTPTVYTLTPNDRAASAAASGDILPLLLTPSVRRIITLDFAAVFLR